MPEHIANWLELGNAPETFIETRVKAEIVPTQPSQLGDEALASRVREGLQGYGIELVEVVAKAIVLPAPAWR